MPTKLDELKATWQSLGEEDPLWAVLSHPDKRGGGWDLAEFLATGEEDVRRYSQLIERVAHPRTPFRHVLDFGCGLGRLVRPWSSRAELVSGADISAPMLVRAREILSDKQNVRLVLNEKPDLSCFKDAEFDLVFSLICLQHMPWRLAAGYLREFARVTEPGGLVAFQLPTARKSLNWAGFIRQNVIDHLPFGLSRLYRRLRHGNRTMFEMNCTPANVVEHVAHGAGLRLLHLEPDAGAGPGMDGAFYIFKRRRD